MMISPNTLITEAMMNSALSIAKDYMDELEEGYSNAEIFNSDETICVDIEAWCDIEGSIKSDYFTPPYFEGTITKYPKKVIASFYDKDIDDWYEIDITDKIYEMNFN